MSTRRLPLPWIRRKVGTFETSMTPNGIKGGSTTAVMDGLPVTDPGSGPVAEAKRSVWRISLFARRISPLRESSLSAASARVLGDWRLAEPVDVMAEVSVDEVSARSTGALVSVLGMAEEG